MTAKIVITHALLIDGNGGEPLPDMTVVVADGIIQDIISDDTRIRTSGARLIDLKGKTLMPGLIDAHVHIGNIEISLERTTLLPPAVYVHRASKNLETEMNLGFTTIRDAAGLDRGFEAAIEQGLIHGPLKTDVIVNRKRS